MLNGLEIPDGYFVAPLTLSMDRVDVEQCITTYYPCRRYVPRDVLEKYRERMIEIGCDADFWLGQKGVENA